MSKVMVKDLKKNDLIKADFLNDNQWHFVLNVGPGIKSGDVYLAVENYGSGQFDKYTEVERKD